MLNFVITDQHGCNALFYIFGQAYSVNYPYTDTMRIVKKLLAQRINVNCHEWTEVIRNLIFTQAFAIINFTVYFRLVWFG